MPAGNFWASGWHATPSDSVTPTPSSNARLLEQDEAVTDDLGEILHGLSRQQKSLSPKFFYDERGSALFDAICELPEYYPTRTELQIMQTHIEAIAGLIGPRASVIELGSGSSLKTRILLEHLETPAAYVPVDISRDHLASTAKALSRDFPGLDILPVAADFTHPFPLPSPRISPSRNLVYFPGSTIGNFSTSAAHDLLRVMHQAAGSRGALLIGVDMKKDPAILHLAYNDRAGITAEFNLNLLRRLNREFGADFELTNFSHRAIWNEACGRIEMHLVSQCEQSVRIGGRTFQFEQDEFLVTEHSHKYSESRFRTMARRAGFLPTCSWTDPEGWFSLFFCIRN
jgi:L-histidine N-alpha-methyltransferase